MTHTHIDKKVPKQTLLRAHDRFGSPLVEFESNYNRFRTINKLLTRHRECGESNYMLLVNHSIILFNIFGEDVITGIREVMHDENIGMMCAILVYIQRADASMPHDEEFLKIIEGVCDEERINVGVRK